MMDDVAAKLKMDPVEFILKNMSRQAGDETPYTTYTLEECIRRGAEAFEWTTRWRPRPGSDTGPIKRGSGVSFLVFRAGLGRSSAVVRVDAKPGEALSGRVRQIAAASDPRTGTYAVEIAIDRPDGLSSGMIGRVEIVAQGAEHLRTVPIESLLEADGDRATLFALGPDGKAKRVSVEVAFVRGDQAAVRGALQGIGRVVTDGAAYLDDGVSVRVTP